MSSQATINTNPIAAFGERLAASLSDETFVRLVLSPSAIAPEAPTRILGRVVTIRGQLHLSLTFRYSTRDEVKNLPAANATTWVMQRLGSEMKGGLLCTTQGDWQLSGAESGQARLIRHKPSAMTTLPRTHDQPRRSALDESARDWLEGLGVTDAKGKVRPGMADKHAQVSRFLEIFSHLAHETGWVDGKTLGPDPGWAMVDMGCGKGYLTFGLWHLWHRVWGLPGRVLGVEVRQDLVTRTNALAASIGANELQFTKGSIHSTTLPDAQVLIALHACDTATDDAILRGIRMHTELILVAPCCHKELRPQLGSPEPLAPVLRHGIMAARMADWATGGLRALFLEWAGYRAKIFEFISSEHTAKNLMIAAARERTPFSDPTALQQVRELKTFFGIEHHALDSLLLGKLDK